MSIPGGSAWALARDIAEGYVLVTERTFKNLSRPELDQVGFEIDRHTRELRGESPPLDDIPALQQRNRRLQRMTAALTVLRSYRQRQKT
jgi:hypothetical protein